MNCKKCGKKLDNDAAFCKYCGNQLAKQKKKSALPVIIISVATVVIVAALTITAAILITKKTSNSKKETNKEITTASNSKKDKSESTENNETSSSKKSSKTLTHKEALEIALDTCDLSDISGKKYDQEYVVDNPYTDYVKPRLSDNNINGCIGVSSQDYDGDDADEVLVVEFSDNKLTLNMLEKKNKNWIKTDSISVDSLGNNYCELNALFCPNRADVFTKEINGTIYIYIENYNTSSFFSDGINWSLEQLSYTNHTFNRKNDTLLLSGSSIGEYLSLKKTANPADNSANSFIDKFNKTDLTGSNGLGYNTPLYTQNDDVIYVAGFDQYHEINYDTVSAWQNNNYAGSLKGIHLELFSTYQTPKQKEQTSSFSTTNSDYVLPNSSTAYLTENDLAGFTPDMLRYARNEIYARHGYIFKDETLKAYFSSKSWYTPITEDSISDEALNEFEIANRDLIVSLENK